MTAGNDIAMELTTYLNEALCCESPLEVDTDLLVSGLVDSLMMVDLIRQVESRFGVRLEPADLSPRNFRTPLVLAEVIVSKLAAAPAA